MAKFKVGDKVRIKPLSEIQASRYVYFLDDMRAYAGSDEGHVIKSVDPRGMVTLCDITSRSWDPAWLEPVTEEQRILPGYAIKAIHEDGTADVWLASMVARTSENPDVCVVKDDGTWCVANRKSDFMQTGDNIVKVEVYGYSAFAHRAFDFSVCTRERLWTWEREKPAPKKMTVAEVCAALGYDVEIVKGGES